MTVTSKNPYRISVAACIRLELVQCPARYQGVRCTRPFGHALEPPTGDGTSPSVHQSHASGGAISRAWSDAFNDGRTYEDGFRDGLREALRQLNVLSKT